jgi:hypothetical protein
MSEQEAQRLTGLFGYWRQHIPYLDILKLHIKSRESHRTSRGEQNRKRTENKTMSVLSRKHFTQHLKHN